MRAKGHVGRGVATAVLGVLLVACGSNTTTEHASPVDARSALLTPVDGLTPRLDPAVVAVGRDLFVFGGEVPWLPPDYERKPVRFLNDGALVDVDSGRAEPIPEPPLAKPLAGASATRVGDDVVVVGMECIATRPPEESATFCEPSTPAAATFNLTTRRWHHVTIPAELRSAQGGGTAIGSITDGRAIYEMGTPPAYWTYSPAADHWTHLAPRGSEISQACVANDQLVELSLPTEINGPSATPGLTRFDLTNGATTPPVPVPGGPRQSFLPGRVVCLDDRVLVVGPTGTLTGAQLYTMESGTWTTIPDPPSSYLYASLIWTGHELIVMPSTGSPDEPALAFDPATSAWRTIPDPPPLTNPAVWDGTRIIGYAGPVPTNPAADQPVPQPCIIAPAPAGTSGTTVPTRSCPPTPTVKSRWTFAPSGVFRFSIAPSGDRRPQTRGVSLLR